MATCLHIAHPGDHVIYGFSEHVRNFCESRRHAVLGDDWSVRASQYDDRNHIDARQFISSVNTVPGPVLIVRPIQANALSDITSRLQGRQIVMPVEVYDSETLVHAVLELKALFDLGEPLVPLKRAVALMIMRKLDREQMWGGNAKGYMWADWIPKGRGIDEEFAPHVADLVYLLAQHSILISKVSNSQRKYALNSDMRREIGGFLRDRMLTPALERVFARDGATLSVQRLCFLDEYDEG